MLSAAIDSISTRGLVTIKFSDSLSITDINRYDNSTDLIITVEKSILDFWFF